VGLIKVTSRGKRAADARNETPPQPPLILVRRETPAAFNGNRTGEAEESRKARIKKAEKMIEMTAGGNESVSKD